MQIDFKLAEHVKKENVIVDGWVTPLEIEYGIYKYSWETYFIWRIVNTEHIFRIPLKIVTAKHNAKYIEHVKLTLIQFREDLFNWYKIGLPDDWMVNYWNQFKYLIY